MGTQLDPDWLQSMLELSAKESLKKIENYDLGERLEPVHALYLNGKIKEIKKLKSDVDSFENPGKHFTKQYRILEGYCGKLQTDLDEIDGTGREELRKERKKALKDISEILDTLAESAHDSGIPCPNCEAKEMI